MTNGFRPGTFDGTLARDRVTIFSCAADQQHDQVMTEKNDSSQWHPTEIMLRADLYQKAHERGIDIGDLCNRALSEALGPDHRKVQAPTPPSSVIVARDGGTPGLHEASPLPPAATLHPVINADDPSASTKVKLAKRLPVAVTPQHPAAPEAKEITPSAPVPKKGPVARREKLPAVKKSRTDLLKMFFSSTVSREEGEGSGVSKDEMYETFVRWCRERRILPVPDRRSLTVALKNQFALQETAIGGVPSWKGTRLK
jgi:hypothetical protein